MPIAKRKVKGKWQVYNEETGKVYGSHPTQAAASAQMRAMAANGVDMSGKGEMMMPEKEMQSKHKKMMKPWSSQK